MSKDIEAMRERADHARKVYGERVRKLRQTHTRVTWQIPNEILEKLTVAAAASFRTVGQEATAALSWWVTPEQEGESK